MRSTRWVVPAAAFALVLLAGLLALSAPLAKPPGQCNATRCAQLCAPYGGCTTFYQTCHFNELYCFNQCANGAIMGEPLFEVCGIPDPPPGGSPIFRKQETTAP